MARRRYRASYKADDWLVLLALVELEVPHLDFENGAALLTPLELPCAGMSTTTGIGVQGTHIIFVYNAKGFAKISRTILCHHSSSKEYSLADLRGRCNSV